MTDPAKPRGRPPKVRDISPDPREAASEASDPVIFADARNAASTMARPHPDDAFNDHMVETGEYGTLDNRSAAKREIAADARTQPGDASHITTEHAEEQIEQAQYDAPPHEQGHSRRRSAPSKVGELELTALQNDAWDVAHSQEELIRFDTLGRRWRFYPDQTITNDAVIVFELRKGDDVREQRHSRAAYGTETAREQSDQIVTDLNGAL